MGRDPQSIWRRRVPKKLIFCVAIILYLAAASFAVSAAELTVELVVFNVKTHKVHKLSCPWAERCTKNYIRIKRSEAYNRGGIPCKVCGG